MLMESLSEQNAEKIYGYLKSEDLIYKLDNITRKNRNRCAILF